MERFIIPKPNRKDFQRGASPSAANNDTTKSESVSLCFVYTRRLPVSLILFVLYIRRMKKIEREKERQWAPLTPLRYFCVFFSSLLFSFDILVAFSKLPSVSSLSQSLSLLFLSSILVLFVTSIITSYGLGYTVEMLYILLLVLLYYYIFFLYSCDFARSLHYINRSKC